MVSYHKIYSMNLKNNVCINLTENREIKDWNIHLQKKCQNLQIAKWAMTHPIRPLRSVGGQTKSGLKHIYHRNIKKYKTTNVVKLLKNGY